MSEQKHTPMVVAAARELCRVSSGVCGINNEYNWKMFGDGYLADAEKILVACGAPDLLEALCELKQFLDIVLCMQGGLPPDANGPAAKALAAIRKATGQS